VQIGKIIIMLHKYTSVVA